MAPTILGRPAPTIGRGARPRFAEAQLATGFRLRYAEQGDPAGHPVVLLHGYSDSWFSYSGLLRHLPESLHLLIPDLRGHGDSERPAGGYTMRDLAADTLALLDAKGIARVTVVGHSMGSIVAQQTALAAPGRVAGLVLMGSGTAIRNMQAIGELDQAVAALEDPVPEEFARKFQASTTHRPIPTEFMDRAVAESLRLPARVWRAVMAGMLAADPPIGLAEAGVPTLILWGDRDAYFLRAEQEALLALVPGATLRVYPETGHALHWERPEEVARDLTAFVART